MQQPYNLRQHLHSLIDGLSEDNLIALDAWLQKKQKREQIMGFAGSWEKLPETTLLELDTALLGYRNNTRRERFDF